MFIYFTYDKDLQIGLFSKRYSENYLTLVKLGFRLMTSIIYIY